jgi:excinuclease ABC subunit A
VRLSVPSLFPFSLLPTLIVIEHNLDVIKCADWLLDLGPGGGSNGGQTVAVGTPEQVAANEKSVTGKYLAGVL